MTRRLATGLLLVALTVGVVSSGAAAQTGPPSQDGRWWLMPAGTEGSPIGARTHFFYEVIPGQVLQDSVILVNPTDEAIEFRLYPSDAYNLPPVGSLALRAEEERQEGIGSWIDLRIREVTLEAGKQAQVPFAVRVPPNAQPGDHAGGIVALNVNPEERTQAGDVDLGIRRSVGVRIYARVDGPLRPGLLVRNIVVEKDQSLLHPFGERGGAKITYEIVNSGNVRLRPTVEVEIKGLLGRTIHRFEPEGMAELFPGGVATRTVTLDALPVADRMTVRVTATADDAAWAGSARRWVIPFLSIVLVVLLVLLLASRRWMRRRRGKRPDAPLEAPRSEVPV